MCTLTMCALSEAMPRVSDLLPRASDGDPEAWKEIVRRYGGLVSATVRSYRLQNDDVLDAVQMTWLRLVENVHRVQFPERLGAWLATTAQRECLRIIRDRAKLVSDPMAAETVADPSAGPEQCLIDVDIAQTLRNLLAQLPPRGQALLRALFADNPRSYAEIAHAIRIPIGSIGPTRARALEQLRRLDGELGLGLREGA
jgi:RNA polymerase sigma factor (sigma-70 family)